MIAKTGRAFTERTGLAEGDRDRAIRAACGEGEQGVVHVSLIPGAGQGRAAVGIEGVEA